jgi:hypothetical protein
MEIDTNYFLTGSLKIMTTSNCQIGNSSAIETDYIIVIFKSLNRKENKDAVLSLRCIRSLSFPYNLSQEQCKVKNLIENF